MTNAKYPGNCACCGKHYESDTPIDFVFEFGGWVVVNPLHNPKPGTVCPKCFIEIPVSGNHHCEE